MLFSLEMRADLSDDSLRKMFDLMSFKIDGHLSLSNCDPCKVLKSCCNDDCGNEDKNTAVFMVEPSAGN